MPAQGVDFARMALQVPPAEYDQTYMRTLIGNIERLLRSRLGRGEEPSYWGAPYTRVHGTATAQVMTIGVDTLVQFNTLDLGRDSMFELTGSNQLKALTACDCLTFLRIRNTATTGAALVKIFKNGASYTGDNVQPRAQTDIVLAVPIVAATNDLFTVIVNTTVAMNLDLTLSSWVMQRISADARLSQ